MNDNLTAALAQFFEEDEWPAVFDTDEGAFIVRFQGSQSTWTCYAYAIEDEEQVAFYSVAPVMADEAHRVAVAEYLTRANYGLVLGNFEMDFEDGEIRFKTSIDVEGAELQTALIRHIVHANVQAMDRYLPGLMLVLADGATPAEAAFRMDNA